MTVQPQSVLKVGDTAAVDAAIALLVHYFDLAPASAQLLVKKWRHQYPVTWTRAAVTEALYQGRYKPISVEQILAFWLRRGRTIPHFNAEFETIIAVPLKGEQEIWETDAADGVGGASTEEAGAPAEALAAGTGTSELPSIASTSPASISTDAASVTQPRRPRLQLPGERIRPRVGFESLLEPEPRGPQVTQGPDPAGLAMAKAQQFQPLPIGPFVPAQDESAFSSRLRAVAEQITLEQSQAPPTAEASAPPPAQEAVLLPELPSAPMPEAIATAIEDLLRQPQATPAEAILDALLAETALPAAGDATLSLPPEATLDLAQDLAHDTDVPPLAVPEAGPEAVPEAALEAVPEAVFGLDPWAEEAREEARDLPAESPASITPAAMPADGATLPAPPDLRREADIAQVSDLLTTLTRLRNSAADPNTPEKD